MTDHATLLACYRSGQIPEAAWQEHLKDEGLRAYVETARLCEELVSLAQERAHRCGPFTPENLAEYRASAALTTMSAELAAVKAERDLMAREWCDFCEAMDVAVDTQEAVAVVLQSRAERAGAALAEARKALEPFAALADIFDHPGGNRPREGMIAQWSDHRVGDRDITVEHLRAARRAHKGGEIDV